MAQGQPAPAPPPAGSGDTRLRRETHWFEQRLREFVRLGTLGPEDDEGTPRKPTPDQLANGMYGEQLFRQLLSGQREIARHRLRLKVSYLVLVVISSLTFAAGLALLWIPVHQTFFTAEKITSQQALAGLAGAGQLVMMLVYSPAERLQRLMTEMTKLTILLEAFQYNVNLQLIRYKKDQDETIREAAERIRAAATESVGLLAAREGEASVADEVAKVLAGGWPPGHGPAGEPAVKGLKPTPKPGEPPTVPNPPDP